MLMLAVARYQELGRTRAEVNCTPKKLYSSLLRGGTVAQGKLHGCPVGMLFRFGKEESGSAG